jgi:hypothetical protein
MLEMSFDGLTSRRLIVDDQDTIGHSDRRHGSPPGNLLGFEAGELKYERRIGSIRHFLSWAVVAHTGAGRVGDDWLLSDQHIERHQFNASADESPKRRVKIRVPWAENSLADHH